MNCQGYKKLYPLINSYIDIIEKNNGMIGLGSGFEDSNGSTKPPDQELE